MEPHETAIRVIAQFPKARITINVDGQAFHFSSFVQLAELEHNAQVFINLLNIPSQCLTTEER